MTAASETPFADTLAALATRVPDRSAVVGPDRTISFAELDDRSTRLAHCYAELGVTTGSMVTIALPNSSEFFESMWAAWKLGAIPQPVSARLPSIERAAIIELADASLVVGVEPGESGGRPTVPIGFEPPDGTSTEALPRAIAPAWKAPTSGGSTGRPKLVVAGTRAVTELITPGAALFRIEPDGTMLIPAPLYHSGPMFLSAVALLLGNTIVVTGRFDAEESLRLVEEHQVTWMYAVPTMMQRIWRLPEHVRTKYDVSSLTTVLHSAAPCPAWLKQAWIDWLGDAVFEIYGGTEGLAMTAITGNEWLAHPGSVGRCIFGEMRILDDDGNDVPPGTTGGIWMRPGEDVPPTYRYVGADARVRAGWESLGDLGRMDEDGYLYIADRDTDMILVGGANVYPAEVEAALDAHPAVVSSCVIGLPHEDLGNVPHAIVQLDGDVSDDDLMAHLRERLVTYKLPRSIERSVTPLRDDAGKVRRSALRAERVAAR
ncbi:MAG: bile acid-coenzyme ligase [Actinomycetota bacterium]|jgi:bile acid-coenzyme A ligase